MQWLEWEGFRFLTSQESTFSRCFGANIAGVLLYEQSLRVFFGGNWEYGTNIVPFDAFICSVSLSPSPTNHVWIEQHLTIYKRKEKIKTRGFNFTMKMEVTFGGFCLQRTKLFPASLLSFALSFLYSVSCNVNTCFFAVKRKPKNIWPTMTDEKCGWNCDMVLLLLPNVPGFRLGIRRGRWSMQPSLNFHEGPPELFLLECYSAQ